MATGGRWVEAYYVRGMLEIRPTLHLALRLAVRCNQVLVQSGSASEEAGLWRAALPVFVVLDVVIWLRLRRTEDFGLSWRLPLDAFDVALWAASPLPASGHYELAILVATPLSLEAGVRMGWRGLLVAAAVVGSTGLAITLAGKPVRLLAMWWLVLSVVMGIAFFRYCRHLDERAEAQRQRAQDAVRRRAYLAGQNQVAMGASSAVDVIEGLVPVLGRPPPGSALWRLADGWKSQLSASTAQEAKYLKVALLEWERAHNRHPDLSGLVEIHLDEGEGTTLLTATQARQLHQALDRMDLRGPVTVRLPHLDPSRLPGQTLPLDVDGRTAVVPPDRRAAPPSIDPCAVSYLYIATLTAAAVLPELGGLPVAAAVAGVATCAVVGTVSHRRIVAQGEAARLGAFVMALPVGIVLTLLSHFSRSPVTADGEPIFGFGFGLLLFSFLGGFYWRSLRGWRWLFPAAVAGNVVLGVLVFPLPAAVTPRALLASLIWNLFPYFPSRHLATALERARDRHAASVHVDDEGAEHRAFLDGQESVIGLVRQARDDALGQLNRLAPRLDPRVAELAADRLEEVERRLKATGAGHESSSSTTTS